MIGSLCRENHFDLVRWWFFVLHLFLCCFFLIRNFRKTTRKLFLCETRKAVALRSLFLLFYSRYVFCKLILQKSVLHPSFFQIKLCLRDNQLNALSISFKALLILFAYKHLASISVAVHSVIKLARFFFQLLCISPRLSKIHTAVKKLMLFELYSIFVHFN